MVFRILRLGDFPMDHPYSGLHYNNEIDNLNVQGFVP